MNGEPAERLDLSEKSRTPEGKTQTLDRRLYMQLHVFGECDDARDLIPALTTANLPCVLYEDLHDPLGVGLLTFAEDPAFFVSHLRKFLQGPPFRALLRKPEYTLFGRTYAQGDERDLAEALLARPRQRVCNPKMPWALWYPLRRTGAFEQLPAQEQRVILMEHGGVGHAFGRAGYGTDIRLACHGLDRNDNDFVVGLLGPDLYPLSAIVQRMRKTKQTSHYLERLGPFFAGRAILQQDRAVPGAAGREARK